MPLSARVEEGVTLVELEVGDVKRSYFTRRGWRRDEELMTLAAWLTERLTAAHTV